MQLSDKTRSILFDLILINVNFFCYNLSIEKYKELGKLRRQSATLRARIIQTIETLLRSQDMKEKIADKYVPTYSHKRTLFIRNI